MASRAGVIHAQKLIATLWSLTKQQVASLEDNLPTWGSILTSVSDEVLHARIREWPNKTKAPTLAELLAPRSSSPVHSGSGPEGCLACHKTGLRQVARWVRDDFGRLALHETSARCSCPAGDRRPARVALQDLVDSWEASGLTADGPHVDPGPHHRIRPDRRQDFLARADARFDRIDPDIRRRIAS